MWLKRWPRNCKTWEKKIAVPLILTGASYMCEWLPLEFGSAQPRPWWAGALPFLAVTLRTWLPTLFTDWAGFAGCAGYRIHIQSTNICPAPKISLLAQNIRNNSSTHVLPYPWIKMNLDGTLLSPDTYNKIMLYSHGDVYPNVKGRREKTLLGFHN